MSSNEHPDMSGNWSDAKLSGSFFSTETILCSQECSVEYDYAIAEQLAADNARLRELLRRAAPFVPIENTLTPELRKELGNV